jgi:fatty acid desaturase
MRNEVIDWNCSFVRGRGAGPVGVERRNTMPQPDEQHAGVPNFPELARLIAKVVGGIALLAVVFFGAILQVNIGVVLAAVGLWVVAGTIFTFLIAATIYAKDLHDDLELDGKLAEEPDPREFPIQKEDFVREQKALEKANSGGSLHRQSA